MYVPTHPKQLKKLALLNKKGKDSHYIIYHYINTLRKRPSKIYHNCGHTINDGYFNDNYRGMV